MKWRRSLELLYAAGLLGLCHALSDLIPRKIIDRGQVLQKTATAISRIVGISSTLGLVGATKRAVAADSSTSTSTSTSTPSSEQFRALYPYTTPQDFVTYLLKAVPRAGNPEAVLSAMDEFAMHYPMYKLTPFKASILDRELRQSQPTRSVLELGSFFGYSAIHLLRGTGPQCKVTCIGIHTHTYTYIYVYTYIHTHTYTYINSHTHPSHIHTRTHTHIANTSYI